MLTLELDNNTELALKELATKQGKTSEQWLKELISQALKQQYLNCYGEPITAENQNFPDLSEFHKTLPTQKISAGEFCRQMRDEDRY
jgi:hypothetical protein